MCYVLDFECEKLISIEEIASFAYVPSYTDKKILLQNLFLPNTYQKKQLYF